MSTYAHRIREIRQNYNLTQPQFADKIGTTKNQISKYELGKEPIPVKHIIKICEVFNISADWLLGIDRGEEIDIAMAEYHKARNAVYRAQKALQKENITEEEKQAIIDQLQILIEQLK